MLSILTVGLRNTLDFVLLLNSIGVGRTFGCINKLIGKALSNGLDVLEGSLTSTSGNEVDTGVNTTKRGHVNSLAANDTSRTYTSRIFTRASIDDGIDCDLQRVLPSQKVNNLEGVLNDSNSHHLLTRVAAVHHKGVGQTLNNRALGLSEALLVVTSSSVGQVLLELFLVLDG